MTLDDLYRLLRSGHVQAQGIVDTLADPLLVLDGGLTVRAANPAFLHAFGLGRDEVLGRNLFQLGQEGWNVPELRRLLGEVIPKAQAVLDYEVCLDVPQQGPRTLLLSARRLAHPDHNSPDLLLVFHDTTDASRRAAQKDMLLAESQHRLKNLMAVVQALVSQTKATGRSAEAYRDALLGRLAVLAQAQELEFGGKGAEGADLRALVARALRPFSRQVLVAPGPDVPLSPAQVLPLSLILHELSTNAAKYGSLTTASGRVSIGWTVAAAKGEQGRAPTLVLDWSEADGPAVTPPDRPGFGTRLISLSVGNDLGGTVEQRFEPTGLVTRIEVPLV
jgi:two-component sensor histidine kinase